MRSVVLSQQSLELLNDLERAIQSAPQGGEIAATVSSLEGVSRVLRRAAEELRKGGVVDTVGEFLQGGRTSYEVAFLLSSPVTITSYASGTFEGENETNYARIDFLFGQIIDPTSLEELTGFALSLDELVALESEGAFDTTDPYLRMNITELGKFITALESWNDSGFASAVDLLSRIRAASDMPLTVKAPRQLQELIDQGLAGRLEQLEQRATESLEKIQTATTKIGQAKLSGSFLQAKAWANVSAWTWTAGVFLCVVAGIALPVWALTTDHEAFKSAAPGLAGLALKVAIGLPLFGLAAYCGHVAAQHRETARHMSILSAQLNQVQAYSDILDPVQGQELLMLLGKRTFSDPGLAIYDKGKVSYIPDDVIDALRKVAQVISKTQTPGKE